MWLEVFNSGQSGQVQFRLVEVGKRVAEVQGALDRPCDRSRKKRDCPWGLCSISPILTRLPERLPTLFPSASARRLSCGTNHLVQDTVTSVVSAPRESLPIGLEGGREE